MFLVSLVSSPLSFSERIRILAGHWLNDSVVWIAMATIIDLFRKKGLQIAELIIILNYRDNVVVQYNIHLHIIK